MLMFRAQYYIQVRQGLRPVFHNFFFFQNWLHQEKLLLHLVYINYMLTNGLKIIIIMTFLKVDNFNV